MNLVDKQIGRLIKKAREHLKLAIEDVADELGIATYRMMEIEDGEVRPTPYQLLSLCALLRVQPNWFFPELWNSEDTMPFAAGTVEREGAGAGAARDEPTRLSQESGVELVMAGGIRVKIANGFDEATLRRVVAIFRSD